MEINDQLSKPLIDRLCYEYKELENALVRHSSEETEKLKVSIQKRIRQIEAFNFSIEMVQPSQEYLSADFRDTIRQLKLDLRFAKRRWQRILLNEGRIFKRSRKDIIVVTRAA